MIWRDTWDKPPGVVIVSEQGEQGGELDAVLLALRLPTLPPLLHVTNKEGASLTLSVPPDLDPFSMSVRTTLKVKASGGK